MGSKKKNKTLSDVTPSVSFNTETFVKLSKFLTNLTIHGGNKIHLTQKVNNKLKVKVKVNFPRYRPGLWPRGWVEV